MHAGGNLFGSLFQVADTVAAHSYLDGIRSRIIVHLLEADIAIREIVGIMVGILVEHLLRSIIAHGIYNELCEVWSANLWSVCSVKTWRSLSDKHRYGSHFRVSFQNISHGVGYNGCLFSCRTVGKIEFNGKLVALCDRHHSLWQFHEYHGSSGNQSGSYDKRGAWKGKTTVQQPRISRLQIVKRFLLCVRFRCAGYALVYHDILQIRSKQQ